MTLWRYLVLWLLIIRHSTKTATCDPKNGTDSSGSNASTSSGTSNSATGGAGSATDLNADTLKKLSIFKVDEPKAAGAGAAASGTKQMTENEYEIKKVDNYSDFYVYNFKQANVKLVEVKFDNNTVWKHDASEHGSEYPRRIFFHVRCMLIFVNLTARYLGYSWDDAGKGWVKKYDRTPSSDGTSTDVPTVPEGAAASTSEPASAASGSSCPELAQLLEAMKDGSQVKIDLAGGAAGQASGTVRVTLECPSVTVTANATAAGTAGLRAAPAPPAAPSAATESSGESATSGCLGSAAALQYGLKYKYQGKDLVEVKYQDTVVWAHAHNDPFPKSTCFLPEIWLLTIKVSAKQFYFYEFDGQDWQQTKAKMKSLVDLKANRKSTPGYLYAALGRIDTYLPGEEFLVRQVVWPKPRLLSWFISQEYVIWHTEVPEEYASRVVVDRGAWLEAKRAVTIQMLKGCEVTFTKAGLRQPFVKTAWSEPTFKLPPGLFITTADSADGTGARENDNSQFRVYRYLRKYGADAREAGAVYRWRLELLAEAKCIKVEYQNKCVWTNEGEAVPLPRAIDVDLDAELWRLSFEDETKNVEVRDQCISNMVAAAAA